MLWIVYVDYIIRRLNLDILETEISVLLDKHHK